MTRQARFCYNNYLGSDMTYSSQLSASYPASNVYNSLRSRVWKFGGNFTVTSTNNTVHVNGTTFTVPSGNYTVSSLITAFGTASGGLSLTLARNSGIFQISGASFTLNLSTTTNAIWDTLGFLSAVDITGPLLYANEARYSNVEWLKVDVGLPQSPDFSCLIPKNGQAFTLTPSGEVYLEGNNVDLWDAPEVSERMEVDYAGAFLAPADLSPCRYWRIAIYDKSNSDIQAAQAYIGSAVIPTATNIATGFSRASKDLSNRMYSESGAMFVDRRPKIKDFGGMGVQLATGADLRNIEQLLYDVGTENPFFLCLDPELGVSERLSEMTHYVTLESDSVMSHELRDYYNISFSLREVI